ncbi:MAG: spermidine synthase [Nitrospinae bacterium]|nr:spermidine synthase [Nitrospinota bacterium]
MYESIWTHYLKLFLGHAAYAQTLVLALFMGGLAAGAWLAGKWSQKIKNPLAAYALVEFILGVWGWAFHYEYVAATAFAYDSVLPALPSPFSVGVFQYLLSAALILPQTILLGSTFPLISAALMRAFPQTVGYSLSMLYFTNSLGGAAGIIASGFLLVPRFGLPGTLLAAALLNGGAGFGAWLVSRGSESPALIPKEGAEKNGTTALRTVFLAAAFVTGASSFMYEVGWLRMLSLVLGASTHAFELMVGAFILGLAFGGFWIRKRIDAIADKTAFAGYVQIAMGLLALATLPVYSHSFEVMAGIIKNLPKTGGGYIAFNAASHLIAAAVMVPAALCAGMTLPLFTAALVSGGHGEKSIGEIYAFNTAGAIAGVAFAIYLGMPLLGLKGLCLAGAALDAVLGCFLLYFAGRSRRGASALAAFMAAGLAAVVAVPFKAETLASGVYRNGSPSIDQSERIVFHKDGRTATVTLMQDANGTLTVATNGKPDASINILPGSPPSSDESTQTLLGALPLLFNPGAESAVNIGMGSGFTTRVLLASPSLHTVETIEIEPAMVEAARRYRAVAAQSFDDPRSHIHLGDAKAYFARNRRTYDVIVSEPSNPWVSGVSGLFSKEFYSLVSRNLNPGGIYVQWVHLYETDALLFASIVNAMDDKFSDWAVYSAHMSDVIIVARKGGTLTEPSLSNTSPELSFLLARVGVRSPDDLRLLRLGGKHLLSAFFNETGVPPNSDYFPYLDTNAVKARYLQTSFFALNELRASPLPLLDMLEGARRGNAITQVTSSPFFMQHRYAVHAQSLRDFILTGAHLPEDMPNDVREAAAILNSPVCGPVHDKALLFVARNTLAFLSEGELARLWTRVSRSCGKSDWLQLVQALSARDAAATATTADKLLATADFGGDARLNAYVLKAGMLGQIAQGENGAALDLFNKYEADIFSNTSPDFTAVYLRSLAEGPVLPSP